MRCPFCGAPAAATLYRCGYCNNVLPPPPGVAPREAVAARPQLSPHLVGKVRPLAGAAYTAIGVIWLAALVWVMALLPVLLLVASNAEGELHEDMFATFVLAFPVIFVLAAAAFLTWLFLARLNINAFPEATAQWGEPWAITAWFVPVVGPLIGGSVVADVARNSVDGFGRYTRKGLAARVWWWWVFCLLAVAFAGVILRWPSPIGNAFVVEIAHSGVYVSPGAFLVVASQLCALAAAGRITGIIARVSTEHRHRTERVWRVDPAAPAAVGDPFGGAPVAGGAS